MYLFVATVACYRLFVLKEPWNANLTPTNQRIKLPELTDPTHKSELISIILFYRILNWMKWFVPPIDVEWHIRISVLFSICILCMDHWSDSNTMTMMIRKLEKAVRERQRHRVWPDLWPTWRAKPPLYDLLLSDNLSTVSVNLVTFCTLVEPVY